MAKTILVTGGTGFIAGEVIERLLERGHAVHTTVRSRAKSEAGLRGRWPNAGERLKLFEAELLDDAGWAEAAAGCGAVAHVASPLPVKVPRDENELIVPAREGTLRALRFAHAAGIRHFVQTSSNAAISYGHPRTRTRFDERDWTNVEAPGVQPYIKSKTIAERAARDWVAANAPEMAFCSVNPALVLGPVASDDFSASGEVVRRLLTGGVPMADVARVLRARLGAGARKVPKRRMPDFVLRLVALASRDIRQLAGEIGSRKDVSGQHARDVLGWTTLPAEQTIVDTARSLIAQGIVKV
jgi:nucleoside-diphosphate-sugar epimerase